MCRYCEPTSADETMCPACTRRYQRLSRHRRQLRDAQDAARSLQQASAQCAVLLDRLLDDLAGYSALRDAGCVIPPIVLEELERMDLLGVERPQRICMYCGKPSNMWHTSRQCDDCYLFYNLLKTRYYTGQLYACRHMIPEIKRRFAAGLKVPRVVRYILQDEKDLAI